VIRNPRSGFQNNVGLPRPGVPIQGTENTSPVYRDYDRNSLNLESGRVQPPETTARTSKIKQKGKDLEEPAVKKKI
jgi:hypothetical protein